jgi:uncharacterized protein
MNILVAGGTGFIGQAIIKHLKNKHKITVLTRNLKKANALLPGIEAITWLSDDFNRALASVEVVINLVGENIGDKRWSHSVKSRIIDSRVRATSQLCVAINALSQEQRPRLLNASAIGIYGLPTGESNQDKYSYNETSVLPQPAHDFLSEVGSAWEKPLNDSKNTSIVRLRFGVVLHPDGGMLKKLRLPYLCGLAGRIGSGEQFISWVALEDAVAVIDYILENPKLTGAFNIVAPQVLSQKEFARAFAKHLKRPCFIPMPSFAVKLLFGQMGKELLLSGQKVESGRLNNFSFKCPTLEIALVHWTK